MQHFKTISFVEGEPKTLTISFSDKENLLYSSLSSLSSNDIRSLIGVNSLMILTELAKSQHRTLSQQIKFLASEAIRKKSILPEEVTFKAGKNEPFQRWYPYIEGYSPSFVKTLIENNNLHDIVVYEPFAGTGTTILASDSKGIDTVYSEVNPLLRLLISLKIKIQSLGENNRNAIANEFLNVYNTVKNSLREKDSELENAYYSVFKKSKYFSDEIFNTILQYSFQIKRVSNPIVKDLLNIALATTLVPVSFLKKQGDLRFKTQKELLTEVKTIDDVLPVKVQEIYDDILNFDYTLKATHYCATPNAKLIGGAETPLIGAVITSPPYLNGTNYIRNTKLELWYLGMIKTDADLRTLRDDILTSGINDVKVAYKDAFSICELSPLLNRVITELNLKAYDKRIPLMAVCYFNEMFQVFNGLKSKLLNGAVILIDLGDSIFSEVHIPTDKILIEILRHIGYTYNSNQILRTRRSRNGSVLSQFLITLQYFK
ncbi:hypothetical protein [uncultured Muribaculum sp.]|uniref:hypothetical protein n=1 Tax=uncultured Muribaculum sp. TaxID=1918613 RepID=UPI0025865613|nr:hypothetical protein [uncultured Muribaculum sp.]